MGWFCGMGWIEEGFLAAKASFGMTCLFWGSNPRRWHKASATGEAQRCCAPCDLVEAGGYGFYYGAVGVVVFQGPDVGAA